MTPFRHRADSRLRALQNLDGWLVLAVLALCLVGLVFIGSATADDALFGAQQGRQALFVAVSFGCCFFAGGMSANCNCSCTSRHVSNAPSVIVGRMSSSDNLPSCVSLSWQSRQ